jgi:hypothetical protein
MSCDSVKIDECKYGVCISCMFMVHSHTRRSLTVIVHSKSSRLKQILGMDNETCYGGASPTPTHRCLASGPSVTQAPPSSAHDAITARTSLSTSPCSSTSASSSS